MWHSSPSQSCSVSNAINKADAKVDTTNSAQSTAEIKIIFLLYKELNIFFSIPICPINNRLCSTQTLRPQAVPNRPQLYTSENDMSMRFILHYSASSFFHAPLSRKLLKSFGSTFPCSAISSKIAKAFSGGIGGLYGLSSAVRAS